MDVINSLTNKIVNNNNITGIKRNINCIIKQKKQGKRRRSFWTHGGRRDTYQLGEALGTGQVAEGIETFREQNGSPMQESLV